MDQKTNKKVVFHKDDIVEVVEPYFVQRIGYNLGIDDGLKELENFRPQLNDFLKNIGLTTDVFGLDDLENGSFDKLKRELAYLIIRSKNFGGNRRELYVKHLPEYKGAKFRVIEKKRALTGERENGYQSGENEYEGASFNVERVHVILSLDMTDDRFNWLRIQDCNVKLVEKIGKFEKLAISRDKSLR